MSPSVALRCSVVLLAYPGAQGFIDKAAPDSKAKWSPITAGLPYKFDDVDLDEAATLDVKMREADDGSLHNMSKDCSARRPHFFRNNDCSIFRTQDTCKQKRQRPTYLASYPGSGNTWTRVVLEGTLQIYTGSVFTDLSLKNGVGMRGEGNVDPKDVFPIKTHWPVMGRHIATSWNLCILRDPLHAALSWTSYNVGGQNHSAEAPEKVLRQRFDHDKVRFLQQWQLAAETYRDCGNCKILRFEDIVSNTRDTYLQDILPYLDVDTTTPEVIRRLDCSLERSNTNHATHRSHSYVFEFTVQDRQLARQIVGVELAMHFGYVL